MALFRYFLWRSRTRLNAFHLGTKPKNKNNNSNIVGLVWWGNHFPSHWLLSATSCSLLETHPIDFPGTMEEARTLLHRFLSSRTPGWGKSMWIISPGVFRIEVLFSPQIKLSLIGKALIHNLNPLAVRVAEGVYGVFTSYGESDL